MNFSRVTGLIGKAERRTWVDGGEESSSTLPVAVRSPPESDTLVLIVSGPIGRTETAKVCGRVRELLQSCDASAIVCDVAALVDPDVITVETLARVQLTARRAGHRIRLRHACNELKQLLDLMGLSEVLPVSCG
jgi:ABC-type transporter Mla MlaB component